MHRHGRYIHVYTVRLRALGHRACIWHIVQCIWSACNIKETAWSQATSSDLLYVYTCVLVYSATGKRTSHISTTGEKVALRCESISLKALWLSHLQLILQMSLPESEFPPMLMGDMDPRRGGVAAATVSESLPAVPEENDQLSNFLQLLGLEKYEELFQRQAVDYNTLLSFSDDDLKKLGIK